ncbi:MAG: putative lipid II flippase FtsW [Rhodospirillaceae bacterium]|nr:putative lipid II flippase FtsW [Rhodospirillaceae bacterium]
MARKLKPDKLLFFATLALLSASVIMVYSASALLAMDRYARPYHFLLRQVSWAVMGCGLLWGVMRIDYRRFRQPGVLWAAIGVTTLALVAVLFSEPINGTRRWFGIAGFGVQPSELAKIALIMFAAAQLERRMERINDVLFALLPLGALTAGIAVLILLQPDFSTAFAAVVIVAAMVFAAGLGYRYLIGAALLFAPALYFVVASAPYRRRRLMAFLDPWADPLGDGFQVIQSQIAVGTGGVVGKGLMRGVQKLHFLPYPHTDFIYAVIAEETGLIGATVILLCFAVITWRGLHVANHAPDRFGAFLAIGLTTMVAIQAFLNMSVVLGLMPTTGIPLPFVSAGGSSLLIGLVGMGILLNVSQHAALRH